MLAIKYAFFALLATLSNLGTQFLFFQLYQGPFSLYGGIMVGTAIGLVVKYVLDKRYIFYYQTESSKQNVKVFCLYTFTGVFTTIIFWGTEITFDALFGGQALYLGGAIGLAVGYVSKYVLDRQFVFRGDT